MVWIPAAAAAAYYGVKTLSDLFGSNDTDDAQKAQVAAQQQAAAAMEGYRPVQRAANLNVTRQGLSAYGPVDAFLGKTTGYSQGLANNPNLRGVTLGADPFNPGATGPGVAAPAAANPPGGSEGTSSAWVPTKADIPGDPGGWTPAMGGGYRPKTAAEMQGGPGKP